MKLNGFDLYVRWAVLLLGMISIFLPVSEDCGVSRAIAAAETRKNVNLEQMVVTATRSKRSADEVTAVVDIVTEEEIANAAANNVDDVLRRLGGVDIRRPSDFGITSPIDIRIRSGTQTAWISPLWQKPAILD
jgi:outer membrane cobalamin receptor